jgi:DNA-binding CsgD family transcriptional regulator
VAAPAGTSDGLLAALREAGGGLLVEGDPGIGKTRIWNDVVDAARVAGLTVLSTCPDEAGSRLVAGGLIELLRDVPDDVIGQIPGPQARALLIALLRQDPDGAPPDPGTVGVALASVLDVLAARSPVLLAVDDLHWLDATTAEALGTAARRRSDDVFFLLSARTPAEPGLPAPARDLAALDALSRHLVPPLPDDEISALIRSRSGHDLPRTVLARAVEASGGNPFFAVELARVWAGAGVDALDSLPVPPSLRAVVDARLAALPASSLAAVTAAAAIASPSMSELQALGIATEDVVAAERAEVLVVEHGRIRFKHPLIAAAAYDGLTGSERAALHRRITEVVGGVEEQARHRALGADGPDEDVAAGLDAAVARALSRADVHAATDAARLAIRATPPGGSGLPTREYRLARLLFVAGDPEARALLERLCDADVPDEVRGRAQVTMCELACSTISHEVAERYGLDAVATARGLGDDRLLAEAYIYLAQAHQFEPHRARADAITAQELLEASPDPDPSQLAKALALAAGIDFSLGHGLDHTKLERAMDLEAQAGAPAEDRSMGYYAAQCIYADDLDKARSLIDEWVRLNAEYGYERDQTGVLMWRTTLELAAGNLELGEELAAEHRSVAEHTGQAQMVRFALHNQGLIALLRGDFTEASRIGEQLVDEAEAGAGPRIEVLGHRLAGEAALAAGDPALAVNHLARVESLRSPEASDTSALTHLPKLVEARLALGLAAGPELDLYETQARTSDRAGALALAARCRATEALVAADEGAVLAALDDAIRYHVKTGHFPVEHARTLILRGVALRRFKRKAPAREALAEARDLFLGLGSLGWVAVVDAELGRLGSGARLDDELTPTEAKVAEMAGGGMTNKEIAAALFLSPKTVEVHLTRIYRKLGVRSRTELAARG